MRVDGGGRCRRTAARCTGSWPKPYAANSSGQLSLRERRATSEIIVAGVPTAPPPDADGHTVMAGRYTGLGSKAMEVQVFILERASKEDTVAMLRKMADWLEDDWASLTDAERYESGHGPAEEFSPRRPDDFPGSKQV
jgi:hypothetical protein